MTKELFEKAQFGDRFITRGGQEALFLQLTENSEWQFANFYVKDWGQIKVNRENGKWLNGPDTKNDIVGMISSLPSNMAEAAKEYLKQYNESEFGNGGDDWDDDILITFKAGAEWMAVQGVNGIGVVSKLADRAWVTPISPADLEQQVFDNFVVGEKVIIKFLKKR